MDIANKIAIVTGASSGIGRALCLELARCGATVVAVARREDRLRSLIDQPGAFSPGSSFYSGDLADQGFAESVVERTVGRYGRVDILVNNAAMPMHNALDNITPDDVAQVMQINFMAAVWTCLAALPHMRRQGSGTLVNVSSFATKVVPTHETIYVASKSALNGFTRGLWNDLAGSGIHAMLVHPGPIDTEIWDKLQRPGAYSGKRYPPELVAREMVKAMARQKREIVVPRRSVRLTMARLLNRLAPPLIRASVLRMDPLDK